MAAWGSDNVFDECFLKEQRDLVIRVSSAVHTLRLIIENHPRAEGYEIPENLREGGRIYTY